jgi:hypothetical protein
MYYRHYLPQLIKEHLTCGQQTNVSVYVGKIDQCEFVHMWGQQTGVSMYIFRDCKPVIRVGGGGV